MLALEKQVISLEYAKKFYDLGIKQESYFYWRKHQFMYKTDDPNAQIWLLCKDYYDHYEEIERISAFTVAELGVMLPAEFGTIKGISESEWECYFYKTKPFRDMQPCDSGCFSSCETEANCRAILIVDAIKNGITTVEQINERI